MAPAYLCLRQTYRPERGRAPDPPRTQNDYALTARSNAHATGPGVFCLVLSRLCPPARLCVRPAVRLQELEKLRGLHPIIDLIFDWRELTKLKNTYLDALQYFPDNADVLEVAKGRAFLIKKDIFRNLMWYTMPESTKHYPLSIEGVLKIQKQNKEGIKPEALETVEVISGKPKEVEPEFVDVVGQISLRTLERNTQKRR